MSRVAKAPVTIPAGVEVTLNGQELSIKGGKGSLVRSIHAGVEVTKEDNVLKFAPRDGIAGADAQAGNGGAGSSASRWSCRCCWGRCWSRLSHGLRGSEAQGCRSDQNFFHEGILLD